MYCSSDSVRFVCRVMYVLLETNFLDLERGDGVTIVKKLDNSEDKGSSNRDGEKCSIVKRNLILILFECNSISVGTINYCSLIETEYVRKSFLSIKWNTLILKAI